MKDRIAEAMIEAAEQAGKINKDTVIVEATSGNTGIGLAMVCAARGYKLAITMPESMSKERKMLLRAFGAELILTPAAEGMAGAIAKPSLWWTNIQILTLCRANSIMRPILKFTAKPLPKKFGVIQTAKVDIFVAGVGTGGTITGVGEVLKKHKPEVQIVAVEPEAPQY